MVFILQHNFRPDKKIRRELTYIYGVHSFLANQICDQLGLKASCRVSDLTSQQLEKLVHIVQHFHITGGDLKRLVSQDIQRYVQIGLYKGVRFTRGLPVRGQRTHTNAKSTRKKKSFFA